MAKHRLTLLVVVVLAIAGAFWFQQLKLRKAEENVATESSRTISEVFSRANQLKVGDLHGDAVAIASDDQSCALFTATQKTRAPYEVIYFIDLHRVPRAAYRWNRQQKIMSVDVPDVTMSRPAIDFGQAKTEQRSWCLSRRAGRELQRTVARRLAAAAKQSAGSAANIEKARNSARDAIAANVRNPLLAVGLSDVRIAVRFPGETKPANVSVEHWDESTPIAEVIGTK